MELNEQDKIDLMTVECRALIDTMMTVYGQEEAMAKWNQIADIIGVEIKNRVMLDAIMGVSKSYIFLAGINHIPYKFPKKITAINWIRSFTGCTLTEAKLWYEECERGVKIKLAGNISDRQGTLRGLKDCGVEAY